LNEPKKFKSNPSSTSQRGKCGTFKKRLPSLNSNCGEAIEISAKVKNATFIKIFCTNK
jgi:hypothetical protein